MDKLNKKCFFEQKQIKLISKSSLTHPQSRFTSSYSNRTQSEHYYFSDFSKLFSLKLNLSHYDNSSNLKPTFITNTQKAQANFSYWGLYKSAQSRNFGIANSNLNSRNLLSGKLRRGAKHSPRWETCNNTIMYGLNGIEKNNTLF